MPLLFFYLFLLKTNLREKGVKCTMQQQDEPIACDSIIQQHGYLDCMTFLLSIWRHTCVRFEFYLREYCCVYFHSVGTVKPVPLVLVLMQNWPWDWHVSKRIPAAECEHVLGWTRLWVSLHLFSDMTHSQKHAIVCRRNIVGRGMQSCFLHRGFTNNARHRRTVGGSLWDWLLRTELGCRKNGQEKTGEEKI